MSQPTSTSVSFLFHSTPRREGNFIHCLQVGLCLISENCILHIACHIGSIFMWSSCFASLDCLGNPRSSCYSPNHVIPRSISLVTHLPSIFSNSIYSLLWPTGLSVRWFKQATHPVAPSPIKKIGCPFDGIHDYICPKQPRFDSTANLPLDSSVVMSNQHTHLPTLSASTPLQPSPVINSENCAPFQPSTISSNNFSVNYSINAKYTQCMYPHNHHNPTGSLILSSGEILSTGTVSLMLMCLDNLQI